MGIVARQSILNTGLLYAGVFIGFLNVTIFFPATIGGEAYGLTRILLSIVFIAQQFAMAGTPSMVIRYFPRFQELGMGRLIRYSLKVLLIAAAIVVVALVVLQDPIIEAKREDSPLVDQYYWLCIPILLAMVLHAYMASLCRANYQTSLPILTYDFLFKILISALLGFVYWGDWSLEVFMWCWTGLYFVSGLILLIYSWAKGYLSQPAGPQVDKAFVKESLDFSLFNMTAGASNGIIANIDIIMVGILLTAESLTSAGVYAIMVYLGNTTMMPSKGLSTIAATLLAGYSERNEREEMLLIYQRTSLSQLVVTGFLFIGVFVNLPSLFVIMKIDYSVGMPVFVLIGLSRLIQAATGLNGSIINYSKYYRWTTYFVVGLALLAIVSNYLLIPRYLLTGAALASLISIGGFELLKLIFVYKKLDLQPFGLGHLRACLVGAFLLAVGFYFPSFDNIWIDMVLRSATVTVLAAILLFTVDISPDLRGMVTKVFSRFRVG